MGVDKTEFRRLLGRFATGVTVVGVRDAAGEAHGMTANAFSSVSLEPPLVLVCVDHRARCHDMIPAAQQFSISFLAADQKAVSGHFAGKPDPNLAINWQWVEGAPVLEPNLSYITCKLWASYPGGDHTIYVGEITGLAVNDGDPLCFYASGYRRLGDPL